MKNKFYYLLCGSFAFYFLITSSISADFDISFLDIKTGTNLPNGDLPDLKSKEILDTTIKLKDSKSVRILPEFLDSIEPVSLVENFKSLGGSGGGGFEVGFIKDGNLPIMIKPSKFNAELDSITPKLPAGTTSGDAMGPGHIPGDIGMFISLPKAPDSGLIGK